MKRTLLIAFILGGTGLSLIAEQTVPGDFLYPVKLNVNEPVRELVAVTAEAEAELALELLRERAAELGVLIGRDRVDASVALAVSEDLTAHAAAVQVLAADTDPLQEEAIRAELYDTLERIKQGLTNANENLTPGAAYVLDASLEADVATLRTLSSELAVSAAP